MKWVALAIAALGFAYWLTYSPVTSIKSVYLSPDDQAMIKATVLKNFINPDTASFRNLRAEQVTLFDGKSYRRICGDVDAKNSDGDMVGFSPFGGKYSQGLFRQEEKFEPCKY